MITPRSVFALFLIVVATGCSTGSVRDSAGTRPPAPTGPGPVPVPDPQRTLTLFGTAFELTATGRTPVAGVLVEEMTCDAASRGCAVNFVQHTTTGTDGAYRITGLFPGRNNFVWITKEGYDAIGRPPVPTCDNCNQIVEMNGDTRLDIELARR